MIFVKFKTKSEYTRTENQINKGEKGICFAVNVDMK